MATPSVKGAMLLPVVVTVRRGRDKGDFSEEQLSKLTPGARELLDTRIQVAQWYPMEHFAELLLLEWEVRGHRAPEYMRESGATNAAAMAQSARYQQLDYVQRADRPKSTGQLISQLRMISSVTLSYYNFMDVKVQMHPEHPNVVQIIYSNTDPFPEALRYSVEGFMNGVNRMRGSERRWTSERVGNTIVFSLEMKLRAAAG